MAKAIGLLEVIGKFDFQPPTISEFGFSIADGFSHRIIGLFAEHTS